MGVLYIGVIFGHSCTINRLECIIPGSYLDPTIIDIGSEHKIFGLGQLHFPHIANLLIFFLNFMIEDVIHFGVFGQIDLLVFEPCHSLFSKGVVHRLQVLGWRIGVKDVLHACVVFFTVQLQEWAGLLGFWACHWCHVLFLFLLEIFALPGHCSFWRSHSHINAFNLLLKLVIVFSQIPKFGVN